MGALFLAVPETVAKEVTLVDDKVTRAGSGSTHDFAPSCSSEPSQDCLTKGQNCPDWFPPIGDSPSFQWEHEIKSSVDTSTFTRAEIEVTAYDVDPDENHTVYLNGQKIGTLPSGPDDWRSLSVDLDPGILKNGANRVTVRSSGTPTRRVAFCQSRLIVYGEKVDLKVKVTPSSRELKCDEAATVQYNVNIQGLSGPADLSVTGLPAGVSAEFEDNPAVPSGGGSTANTKLVITRTGDTARGRHTLTITAKAGVRVRRITIHSRQLMTVAVLRKIYVTADTVGSSLSVRVIPRRT